MKLKLALDEKLMDLRLRDRLVAEGKISKAQVDEYMNGLNEESSSSYERLGGDDSSASSEPTAQ
jgi:hypothetical protein